MYPIYGYTSEIFYIAYMPLTKHLLFDSSLFNAAATHATNYVVSNEWIVEDYDYGKVFIENMMSYLGQYIIIVTQTLTDKTQQPVLLAICYKQNTTTLPFFIRRSIGI